MKVDSVVVVPCYKESKRLNTNQYLSELDKFSSNVVLVDDGSPDDTFKILKNLEQNGSDRFVAIKKPINAGKAEAVRTGMNYAIEKYPNAKYVGFMDADLAVKFSEVPSMIDCFTKNKEINTVIGVRSRLAGHKVDRSFPVYALQRVIAQMGGALFSPKVTDTQCGAKFFDAKVVKKVIKEPFISKWLFDQELLARIFHLPENAYKNWLYEHPVSSWTEIGNSTRKFSDYFKSLKDYFKILKKYGVK